MKYLIPALFFILSYNLQGANFYRVNVGANSNIEEFNICKNVQNASAIAAIMVPTKTAAEFNGFLSSAHPGVNVVNRCCLPWGGSAAVGSNTTAYASSAAYLPSSCAGQSRNCQASGNLTGSYTIASCTQYCNSSYGYSCSKVTMAYSCGMYASVWCSYPGQSFYSSSVVENNSSNCGGNDTWNAVFCYEAGSIDCNGNCI